MTELRGSLAGVRVIPDGIAAKRRGDPKSEDVISRYPAQQKRDRQRDQNRTQGLHTGESRIPNCIHGIDSRFCAACNRSPRSSGGTIGRTTLDEVLAFLNGEQIRATYGAVAEVVGVVPRALGGQLGPRRPEASWVVSAESGLPTDYDQSEWHPALLSRGEVIKSGRALMLRMTIRRGKTPPVS